MSLQQHLDLDHDDILFSTSHIYHNTSNKITRVIPITRTNKRNYYFKTCALEKGTFKCGYYRYNKGNTHLKKPTVYTLKDTNEDSREMVSIINGLKHELINKLKHIMKLPSVSDNNKVVLNINANYKNELVNIIEYNDKKCTVNTYVLDTILKKCKCEMLIQLVSFNVTETNIYIKLRLSRIYILDIEKIMDISIIKTITDSAYHKTINNLRNLKELDNINVSYNTAKKEDVQNELTKILI